MKTHDQFLLDLQNKNPNAYQQYDIRDTYAGCDIPLSVKCRYCGLETNKSPSKLMHSTGCSGCRRIKTPLFLEKLFTKFPENKVKYDYALCVVDGMGSRISYKCLQCAHTIENQSANDHYHGYGCPSCAGNLRYTKKMLIEKSIEKFGSIYDFSITKDFVGKSKKIQLSCPKHGVVDTTPLLHLKSRTGCPKCYRYSASEVLEKFYLNPYNSAATLPYLEDELQGKSRSRKVTLSCPTHGEYKVALTSITSGTGCLKCSQERNIGIYTKSLVEKNRESLLNKSSGIYLVKLISQNINCYKLGIAKNIDRRIREITRDSKGSVEVLYYGTSDAYTVCITEQTLLESLKVYKYTSPFKFEGCTELLTLDDDTASELIEYLSVLTEEKYD